MKTALGLLVTIALWGGDSHSARQISDRATSLYTQARYGEAEPLYRQALEAWNQLGPEFARDRAIDTRNLGSLLRATGRYAEAEPLLLDSIAQLEAAGAGSMDQARALDSLAALYRTEREFTKAETYAQRAVAVLEKKPEGNPAERLGPSLVLASIYMEERRLDEAEKILRPALDAADGAIAVVIYNNLATINNDRGNYPEAEKQAQEALRFAGLALPPTHPAFGSAWTNLGEAYRFQNRYVESEGAYRKAIEHWEKSVGPNHPDVAQALMNLASLLHQRGRESGAESMYRRAAAILEQAFGKDDPRALMARNELAEVLRAQRRYTESAKIERSTLAGLQKTLTADDPRLMRAQSNYARLLQETNR
jgi:tetratricopeptide (TPR) repeat protein